MEVSTSAELNELPGLCYLADEHNALVVGHNTDGHLEVFLFANDAAFRAWIADGRKADTKGSLLLIDGHHAQPITAKALRVIHGMGMKGARVLTIFAKEDGGLTVMETVVQRLPSA